jgi:hypothetical protein
VPVSIPDTRDQGDDCQSRGAAETRAHTPPCKRRGFPTPTSVRIKRPRVKPAACTISPFEDVLMTTQMRPTQAARVVHMRTRPLEEFAAATDEALASSAPALRFRNIRPDVQGLQVRHRGVAVIALVADQVRDRPHRVRRWLQGDVLLGGGDQRLVQSGRVAQVAPLQRHGHERAGSSGSRRAQPCAPGASGPLASG